MGIGGFDSDRVTGVGSQIKGFELMAVCEKNRIFPFDKKG
jgi:hypothetical protein